MSSSTANKRSGDRYVTRRVRDKDGNIVVKRYKKRQSSLGIQIPWHRSHYFILGAAFGLYSYLVNLYSDENLDVLPGETLAANVTEFFDQFTGVTALFVTSGIAVGLSLFMGWAIVTRGFNIRKYPLAARQLLAIVAIFLLLSTVFSSFFNEFGITRQQDSPIDVDDAFDLSDLSAPFYSELLEGLLDLIGNIPNPEEVVANISPTGGDTFDYLEDTYLWRWLVAETYGADSEDPYDFGKGYEEYRFNYENAEPSTFDDIIPDAEVKQFRVSQQYLTLGSQYSGETVNTWNSLYDSQVDFSGVDVESNNAEGISVDSINGIDTINNQPMMEAVLSDTGTSGFIGYDSYFIREDKELISQNSFPYSQIGTAMANFNSNIDVERFGNLGTAGDLSSIWGENSLPSYYQTGDPAFNTKLSEYLTSAADNDLSVYDIVLQVSNEIQTAIVDMFNGGAGDSLDLADSAATANEAPEGTDRAFYFWDQVAQNELFGIKDAIAGFVNLLRMMDIPARPILGFSAGEVEPDNIQLRLEHIHVWVEAFLPWDDNGVTRYSWGAFNPIPNYSYLTASDPEFVYGQNSLGGQPDVELVSNSGETQAIPSGDIGDTSEMVLGQYGEDFNFATRVLFDETPAGGQNVQLKILDEQEVLDLANGVVSPTDIDSIGTSMGTITTGTDPGAWGNVTLNVPAEGNAIFTNTEDEETDLGIEIGAFAPFGAVGSRNIYSIVAIYGFAYEFIVVAFNLQAEIVITPFDSNDDQIDSFSVTDPGIFNTFDTFTSSFSFIGETINLTIDVSKLPENGGDPLPGVEVSILFMSPSDFDSLDDDLSSLNEQQILALYGTDVSGITDLNGRVILTFESNSSIVDLLQSEYYSVVAWLNPSEVFQELIFHFSNEFTMPLIDLLFEDPLNETNFGLYRDEARNWELNTTAFVDDTYLEALTAATVDREANGADIQFILMDDDVHAAETGNDAQILNTLENCAIDYSDVGVECYILSETNTTMGVLDSGVSRNGLTTIRLVGDQLPYGIYRLYLYLPDLGLYFINATDEARIAFLPSFDPGSVNNDDYAISFDDIIEFDKENSNFPSSESTHKIHPIIVLIVAIPIIASYLNKSHKRRNNYD